MLQVRGLAGIREAMAAITEQRSRKRKHTRTEERMTVGEVQELVAEKNCGGRRQLNSLQRGYAKTGAAGVMARLATTRVPALKNM